MIFFAYLAVFYPDGKLPVAGLAVKQPDGGYKFEAYNADALPNNAPSQRGSLKLQAADTATNSSAIQGTMTSTPTTGTGIFYPESGNGEPGIDWIVLT